MVATYGEPFYGHIILDVPAQDPALSFNQIADSLATIVRTSPPRFAVGIFGGWGSGKSTLMDAIRERVAVEPDVIVVEFNAWRYEREPHLIVPLLDTIRAGVWEWSARQTTSPQQRTTARHIAERIGKVVRALVRSTSVDIGIPGAVTLSLDPGRALDEMSEHPPEPGADPQSLYFGAFQELSAAFAEVKAAAVSRLVVFVDDLDRCMPERALTVLESMKLFFDMPGFVFVVGLDEHVVESAVRSKFAASNVDASGELVAQLERDYLKKIFQVPYTLPTMMSGQLKELLWWLETHESLSDVQRYDLRDRVSRFLSYVAADGRINPREVKRFINAYTLNRMIRPDLDADVVLALQTVDFRSDWEQFYEQVLLGEPEVACEVVAQFRAGEDRAFEDLWPSVGVLPPELAAFLRSPEGAALTQPDLGRYASFIETTRSSQSWLSDAMRAVGILRRATRDVEADRVFFGDPRARRIASEMTDAVHRLTSFTSSADQTPLRGVLETLRSLIDRLGGLPAMDPSAETEVGSTAGSASNTGLVINEWLVATRSAIDLLQQQLRVLRRSASFA